MKELTYSNLKQLKPNSYILIDTRDSGSIQFGMIPGAIHIPEQELWADLWKYTSEAPSEKTLILYCQRGVRSIALAEEFEKQGREAFSLSGGYLAYLRDTVSSDKQSSETESKAENSIRRKYHKQLFTPFAKACKQYQLIQEGDHIAVCISGGKDSMLMAKLFQEIQSHRQAKFDLTFLVMDPGYNADNRRLIEYNAKNLGIPITIFESSIFDAVDTVEKSPCYLCARMRRGYLYSKAKELECNV